MVTTVLVNAGALTVSGGSLNPGSTGLTNNATVNVSGTGILTGSQPLTSGPGATTTFSSSGTSAVGPLLVAGGSAEFSGGTVTSTGTTVTGGALTVSGGALNPTTLTLAGGDVTISAGSATVAGNVAVDAGTLTIAGGTLSETAGNLSVTGTLAIFAGSYLAPGANITGAGTINLAFGTLSLRDVATTGTFGPTGGTLKVAHDFKPSHFTASGGTVEFTGNDSGSGFPGTADTPDYQFHNFTIDSGVTESWNNVAFTAGIGGNWTNSGTFSNQTNAGVLFNGSSAQAIGGSSATTFGTVTINNSQTGYAVYLDGVDASVQTSLIFIHGNIATGYNALTYVSGANIASAGSSTGYVIGTPGGGLKKPVANGTPLTRTFEVGTYTGTYAPLTFSATITGSSGSPTLLVAAQAGEHSSIATSGIDPFKDANVFWAVSRTGTFVIGGTTGAYTLGVTYSNADLDPGASPSSFMINRLGDFGWQTPLSTTCLPGGCTVPGGPYTSTSGAATVPYATNQTLGANISASVTTITSSGTAIQTGDVIQIGSERMLVTGGGGTTSLTVVRGQNGSTGATHTAGATILRVPFGALPGNFVVGEPGTATGTISGKVVNDANGNGTDDSEAGLAGASVKLYHDTNGNGTYDSGTDMQEGSAQVTTGTGAFSFGTLFADTYFVIETNPTGFVSTAAIAGTNGATVVTSDRIKVVLANGITSSGNEFLDQEQADLAITKSDGVTTVVAGGAAQSYTITVTNNGPAAATSVNVSDTFPAGFSRGTVTTTPGTCTGSPSFTCSLGTIASSGTVTITVAYTIPSSTTASQTNTATVSSAVADPVSGNNTASDMNTVTTEADLSITKSGPVSATAGDPAGFDFVVTVHNGGPSDNTGGFTVSDTLDAGLTFQTVGSDSRCTAAGQDVTCANTTGLAAGANDRFTIHVTLASTVDSSVTLPNTASVASDGTTDPNVAN